MERDEEEVKIFLVEALERIDQLEQDLVELENNPEDQDLINGIFRALHTIKGEASFLAYNSLEKLSHTGENLLGKIRDGQTSVSADITTVLLSTVDAIREMLNSIEESGEEGEREDSSIIEELQRLQA